MRILVLQTTRMGDVLQTTPLLRQLRARHPDAHISIMVRGMGKAIAERCPDVDEVLVHEEDTLFQHLRAQDSTRLLKAYETAQAQVKRIADGNYDLIYNVTHSIASAMLLKMAGAEKVVGAHLGDDWQYVLRGRWTNYFFTSVFSRDYNDLNLCDITRNFAPGEQPCHELVFDLHDEDHAWAERTLAEHGAAAGGFVACMQLGASENNKRWPEHRFAELARLLRERKGAKIFLVGVKEEAPLGEAFERHAPGLAVPLFGKTSVPQLAALLKRSNVLVTNDTGTMHIAAAVKCPIALISVGHVHYRETGPYGAGHCAVEQRRITLGRSDFVPGAMEERDAVSAEQAFRAVEIALGGVPAMADAPEIANVDYYVSGFAPDGCLQFYPHVRRALTERDLIRMAYRAMWIEHLNDKANPVEEAAAIERILAHFELPDPKVLTGWSAAYATAFDALQEIAVRGTRITAALLECLNGGKPMSQAKQLVSELMAFDEEARIFAEVHPACRPLALMARFERDNLEGSDPKALAETTLRIYEACAARAGLVAAKLRAIAG